MNRISKIILMAIATLGSLSAGYASASLADYWAERGMKFIPCNQERKELAAEFAVWNYDCSAEKNAILEKRLRDYTGDNVDMVLGYSVATGYKSQLTLPITSSQSTITVASLATKDNHTLTMADLGSYVFLTLEPGGTKEEIIKCTGISGSTFTGCTRGLAFYGTSTVAVALNQKTHVAGSSVVMSNVHYVYENFVDTNDKDQTIAGDKTYTGTNLFYSFPLVSSTGYTGLPTQNGQVATKYYVDTVGAGGFTASNIATNEGLRVFGTAPETAGVYVRADKGMVTSTTGIYQNVNTTTGLTQSASGIGLSTSTLVGLIATTTPTASMIPIAGSDAKLSTGWYDGVTYAYTAGESINASTAPLAVYLNSTDGRVYKTSSALATTTFPFIGFVTAGQSKTVGESINVQIAGNVSGFTGMTTGSIYYISTAGTVSSTAGTVRYQIGRAISPTTLLIEKGKKIIAGYVESNLTSPSDVVVTSSTAIPTGFYPSKVEVFGLCSMSADGSTPVAYNEYATGGGSVDGMSGNQAMWVNGSHKGYSLNQATFAISNSTSYLINSTNVARYVRLSIISPSATSISFYQEADFDAPDNDNGYCKYNYIIEE